MGKPTKGLKIETPVLGEQLHALRERFSDYFHSESSNELPEDVLEHLRGQWREHARHWPPAQRLGWLSQPFASQALGPERLRRMLSQLRKEIEAFRRIAPSETWWEAWGIGIEPGLPHLSNGRKFAARMKRRRRALVGMPNRWTPPQSFDLENRIDSQSVLQASLEGSLWPAGPSAAAIERIAQLAGVEERWAGRESLPGTETVGDNAEPEN